MLDLWDINIDPATVLQKNYKNCFELKICR